MYSALIIHVYDMASVIMCVICIVWNPKLSSVYISVQFKSSQELTAPPPLSIKGK